MQDLIIIGGGPAAITAGIYAARYKLKTLLITKALGGQMARKAVAIKNYPGWEEIPGFDLIAKFEEHLKKNPIDIEMDTVREIKKEGGVFFVSTNGDKTFQAKAVIIASGADPRPLEVEGEKEFVGRGVSYCVTCDGPLFSNKTVAVIGGGNAGFEAAISLANWVGKIYILENSPQVKASPELQEKAGQTGKIEVMTSVAVKKIEGGKFVEKISVEDQKTKNIAMIALEGVFVEVGSQPATSFLRGLVDFSEKDEVVIDPKTMQTKTPGLFAAGDVSNIPYKQIVVAAGEGAKALLAAYRFLQVG
jgi:thioredoxin-disulfide reductase